MLHHQTLQTGHTKQNCEGKQGVVFELSSENSSEPSPVGTLGSRAPSPEALAALVAALRGLCWAGEEQGGQQK